MSQSRHEAAPILFLDQNDLAARWRISPRTLERWRCARTGPCFVKMGGKVRYSIEDVLAFERRRRAEMHSSIVGRW